MSSLDTIFKAYDIRGIYPTELDEETAREVGSAYAAVRRPKKVAVGRDVRNSGESLKKALIESLISCGVDVVDIGVITSDQLYFVVGKYGFDGGITVSASHNPGEYNGFKFSDAGGAPITSEKLTAIKEHIVSAKEPSGRTKGKLTKQEFLPDYIEHVLSYIDPASIKPLRLVVNANFGAVDRSVDALAMRLPIQLETLNWQEDGSFPKGPPNPMLPESRDETIALIMKTKPDLGVAWDADADRVFFFTDDGQFVPSCFIISLLSAEFLKKQPGAKIVHDITTAWAIDDSVKAAGGTPVINRTGHTFIKARMRREDAVFAGEGSGHYYFKDSYFADNGIVPMLMILQLISNTGQSLEQLVQPLAAEYKISGETNYQAANLAKAMAAIEKRFADQGSVDRTDGISVTTDKWRFNVRPSNTEPLFRLNAEAHDQKILDDLINEISGIINT